jgi:peptidyl-prolyl cis-trans isomerase C
LASGALARGLDQSLSVEAALRGTLARAVLETLKKEASETAPTDAEVAEVTARHFVELDRPETFRVIHAVVKVPPKADNAMHLRARALAARLAERVTNATDEAEFRKLAESIDERDGLEVVVETLKPVAADGRVVDVDRPSDQQTYVLSFARAASRLTQPGQKSGVVTSEFGFHAMMLLERIPALVVPLDERRRLLRDEILTDRARRLKKDLLHRLQSNVATTVERSTDSILATVDVVGHEAP